MPTEKPKVILSLSGGLDSSVLLAYYLNKGYKVATVSFEYNSKHNLHELRAARNIAGYYGVSNLKVDLRNAFLFTKSALIQTKTVIPEGHYNDEKMKQTVVPGRNLIFTSVLATVAESWNIDTVALAVHSGDHHIYPDCRPEFVKSLNETVQLSSEEKVKVKTPFLSMFKSNIVKLGDELNIPFQLTRTCYSRKPYACGKCGSCMERLEAFSENKMFDPVEYEGDN